MCMRFLSCLSVVMVLLTSCTKSAVGDSDVEYEILDKTIMDLNVINNILPKSFEDKPLLISEKAQRTYDDQAFGVVHAAYEGLPIQITFKDFGTQGSLFEKHMPQEEPGYSYDSKALHQEISESEGIRFREIKRKLSKEHSKNTAYSYESYMNDRYYLGFRAPLDKEAMVKSLFNQCNLKLLK